MRRNGATLLEVTMALLIMAIGVTSLMTLFPLSALKSVQAHNLTDGTNLRYTAESYIEMSKPTPAAGEEMFEREMVNDPDRNGINGDHATPFVMDPLGWIQATIDGNYPAGTLGHDGANPAASAGNITRYFGLAHGADDNADKNAAESICCSQDNWNTVFNVSPESNDAATVTLPASIELTELSGVTSDVRLVLFDTGTRTSAIRYPTDLTLPQLGWGTAADPDLTDPANADLRISYTVEKVMLQVQDFPLSWFLTGRRDSGGVTDVDVVVVKNRGYGAEQVYTAAFEDSTRSTNLTVFWSSGQKPSFKRGGYVMDAQNGYWYRIVNISGEDSDSAIITIHVPPFLPFTQALFIKGIVSVYPIGTKT